MTSRERLQAVLNRQLGDQLCVDLGAGGQTGIGVCALHRLRHAVLGDPRNLVKVIEPYQMLGEVNEDLRQALGLDVLGVNTPATLFGFRNGGVKLIQDCFYANLDEIDNQIGHNIAKSAYLPRERLLTKKRGFYLDYIFKCVIK